MSTLRTLQAVLRVRFNLAAGAVAPDATLAALAFDSLAMIEMVFVLEDEFGITVPTEGQIRLPLRTIGELAEYVDCLMAAQRPALAGALPATSFSASRRPGDGSRRDAFARPRARRG